MVTTTAIFNSKPDVPARILLIGRALPLHLSVANDFSRHCRDPRNRPESNAARWQTKFAQGISRPSANVIANSQHGGLDLSVAWA